MAAFGKIGRVITVAGKCLCWKAAGKEKVAAKIEISLEALLKLFEVSRFSAMPDNR